VWCVQGQAVGSAAHLVALRREAIGKYNVKDAWTVDQLQAAFGAPKRPTGTRPTASATASDGNATKTDEVQQTSSNFAKRKEDTSRTDSPSATAK